MTTYQHSIKSGLIKLTTLLKKGLIGVGLLFLSAAFILPEECELTERKQ
ncbi:hypothetical protein [Candidatus Electronema sp. JM]